MDQHDIQRRDPQAELWAERIKQRPQMTERSRRIGAIANTEDGVLPASDR